MLILVEDPRSGTKVYTIKDVQALLGVGGLVHVNLDTFEGDIDYLYRSLINRGVLVLNSDMRLHVWYRRIESNRWAGYVMDTIVRRALKYRSIYWSRNPSIRSVMRGKLVYRNWIKVWKRIESEW